MHKSGVTIVLAAGDYRAEIVSVGAGIASLTHRGRHLVIPHPPEEMPLAHLGKVLLPWPNRIADGSYEYGGRTFTPAINDRAGNTAIHGLLAWQNWQIVEQTPGRVTLSAFLAPTYGYPFMLSAEVSYWLDETVGLSARIFSRNIGDVTAPYGAGIHPYLTCDRQPVDECELRLPTRNVFDVSRETMLTDPRLDFLMPRPVGGTQIDHTFKAPEGQSAYQVEMTHPQTGLSVRLQTRAPWLQIYSGEKLERKRMAVEPMSCPPNAFNSGIDLVHLNPGDGHSLCFDIGCK
jgi:Galactose mutarotase and related enzymes